MFSSFQRPKGASSDVKEFEYISALHQSQLSDIRTNGTVSATDIQLLMKSRYALDLTDDECLDILRGLGGGSVSNSHSNIDDNDDNGNIKESVKDSFKDDHNHNDEHEEGEDYLDIVQIVSILIIPTILKASHDVISLQTNGLDIQQEMEASIQYAQQQLDASYSDQSLKLWQQRKIRKMWTDKIKDIQHVRDHQPNPRFIIRHVLKILIDSVLNNSSSFSSNNQFMQETDDSLPTFKLTVQSLQALLQTHGEYDMANNIPLLQSMIASCSPPPSAAADDDDDTNTQRQQQEIMLNELAFAKALSSDLQLWTIGCEDNTTTTSYHDVFHHEHVADFDNDIFERVSILQKINPADYLGLKEYFDSDRNEHSDAGGGDHGVDRRSTDTKERENKESNATNVAPIPDIEAPFTNSSHHGQAAKGVTNDEKEDEEEIFFDAMANNSQQISTSDMHLEKIVSWKDEKSKDEENHNDDDDDTDHQRKKAASVSSSDNEETISTTKQEEGLPNHVKFAPYIDYVVDTYRSLSYLMSLWVFYLFSVVLFMNFLGHAQWDNLSCETPTFSCNLVQDLLVWVIIAVTLSIGGLLIIVPISFPNDPSKRSPYTVAFSFVLLVVYTFYPYIFVVQYREGIPHSEDGILSDLEVYVQSDTAILMTECFLAFGCILLFKVLLLFINAVIPNKLTINRPMLNWYLLPSHYSSTANIKLAGTYKVNVLLQNAVKMHQRIEPMKDKSSKENVRRPVNAMQNFLFYGEYHEQCGGFFWTWKRILSKDLTRKEGVWLHGRLAVGQEGQVIVLIVYIVLIFWGADRLANDAQEFRDEIIADEGTPDKYRDWALNVVPEPWMIYASFIPGGIIAFLSGLVIILVYVPSTVTTVLKLRSGVIQTLTNKNFNSHRSSADSIYYNSGNMVYALIGSVALMFLIFGGIIFLFVWEVTNDFMMLVLSWGLGLTITIVIKTILLTLCRANFQSAFFRRHPRRANFSSLAMECWNLGIGGGAMIGRLTQFLLASAFWIGRIDVTFLDANVSLLGYNFDYAPLYYRKEILIHEAHRHPFMERLGALYLMRLKHGKNFSSDAGACWRILFVKALMPWLEKYRGCGKDEE